MSTKSRTTKKDLEAKIAELEAKLSQLSTQVSAKPSTQAPPKQTPPPQPKPSAQTPPPPAAKPVWEQWKDSPMGNWNIQKTKVPGYTAPSNKYFATRVRLSYHAPDKRFTGYGIKA